MRDSLQVEQLEGPSVFQSWKPLSNPLSYAWSNYRFSHFSASDLSISPRTAGIRTRPPSRLWFSHLSCIFRSLPPLPLLFFFLPSCFLSVISICNQNKSSRCYRDTLLLLNWKAWDLQQRPDLSRSCRSLGWKKMEERTKRRESSRQWKKKNCNKKIFVRLKGHEYTKLHLQMSYYT